MNWKSAIIASAVVALIATLLHQVISTGGKYYFAPVDWDAVNKLPYPEAKEYLAERSKSYTLWESLKSSVYYPHFWLSAFAELVFLFIIALASCWLFNRKSNA